MTTANRFVDIVNKLGPRFAERAVAEDLYGRFVS